MTRLQLMTLEEALKVHLFLSTRPIKAIKCPNYSPTTRQMSAHDISPIRQACSPGGVTSIAPNISRPGAQLRRRERGHQKSVSTGVGESVKPVCTPGFFFYTI